MADQDSGIMDESVVRSAMAEFDTAHLCKLSVLIFDRWNWDTGSAIDKRWMEIADEILKERGVTLNMTKSIDGPMISCDPSGPQELTIKVDKLTLKDPTTGGTSVLFESLGGVVLGWDLKKAIVQFIDEELQNNCTMSIHGKYLKDIVAEAVTKAVAEKLY